VRVAPPADHTDGPDAAFLSSGYGLTPDPWQADVVDDWLGRKVDGGYASTLCGLVCGRQNGKNGIIEIRELFGMVVLGEKFLHSAHEVKTSRKAFKRLKWFFGNEVNDPDARFPELNALVVEIRNTNGQEAIVLANGASIEFVARSSGSGRGFTIDVLVLDEAQHLTEEQLEAQLSTISAAEKLPQMIVTGTAPNPEKGESGEVFVRIRKMHENENHPPLSWTDYGVPDGPLPDIDDEELLAATNPGLGYRLHRQVIELEHDLLSPEGYARERLGWWGDSEGNSTGLFGPIGLWETRKVTTPDPDPEAIGIAVSIDRAWSSIAAATADGDKPRIGAVDRRRGTGWLIAEAKRIQDERHIPVVLDGKGPAATLIEKLELAGVDFEVTSTEDYLDACADLFDRVTTNEVEHGDHAELNQAVKVATTRIVGDRFAWARKNGDITMLEAATLALWQATNASGFHIY
jgi:hypothetical protein